MWRAYDCWRIRVDEITITNITVRKFLGVKILTSGKISRLNRLDPSESLFSAKSMNLRELLFYNIFHRSAINEPPYYAKN